MGRGGQRVTWNETEKEDKWWKQQNYKPTFLCKVLILNALLKAIGRHIIANFQSVLAFNLKLHGSFLLHDLNNLSTVCFLFFVWFFKWQMSAGKNELGAVQGEAGNRLLMNGKQKQNMPLKKQLRLACSSCKVN